MIAVLAGLIVLWVALLIALIVSKPADLKVTDILRLLPDTVVLLRRLATDRYDEYAENEYPEVLVTYADPRPTPAHAS